MTRGPAARARLALLAAAAVAATAGAARAEAERYAVVIGNNRGAVDEAGLRYAEEDAGKIARVLRELGGLPAENLVLLRGEGAPSIRRALAAVEARLRARPDGGAGAMLLVFYSGHADAEALHAGATPLPVDELRAAVRGASAAVRLLVVDACRSGALTRVKGGHQGPAFALAVAPAAAGQGAVFLTSSSANEDAQESDELRGSFFTHYLASALQGAGDSDGDGRVVLEEAYRYAYENTLRASSRTLAGTQHPTFQYDLRGQGQIVLTVLQPTGGARGFLTFPAGRSYLLMQGGRDGAVVAEVGARDGTRRLSVRADHYFVRGRGPEDLLEGTVALAAGESRSVDERALERIAYGRLVRKGGGERGERTLAHGPQGGYLLRSPVNGVTYCQGVFVGYGVELPHLTLLPRLSACRSGFANEDVRANGDEFGAHLTLAHAWDLPFVTAQLGVGVGVSWLRQTFSSDGTAPARDSVAGQIGASLGVMYDLPRGFYLMSDVGVESYLFKQQDVAGDVSWTSALAIRATAALGKRL